MWGWTSRGREAAALYFRKSKLTVERCNGLRCSLTKNALPVGFILARSFSHALTALSSSPRRGCVVDNPPFKRATCSTGRIPRQGRHFHIKLNGPDGYLRKKERPKM